MKNITEHAAWHALITHQRHVAAASVRTWFEQDPHRFDTFSLQGPGIFLDYSRQRVQKETISLLCSLARSSNLAEKIDALFKGSSINHTEKRPALHTALRDQQQTPIQFKNENIAELILHARNKMSTFVEQIHSGAWTGITGKTITHVVNIGIGGSHVGPLMTTEALKAHRVTPIQFHFASSVDKTPLIDILEKIDPERTLFIISSKSFNTIETMTNANTVIRFMKEKFGPAVINKHFVAITAKREKAIAFGIPATHIFPIWEWVGGRYSIWSAIGLPLMLMIGPEQFNQFLKGAYEMDQHFKQADFEKNMPVLLALLGIWSINFFDYRAQAIIPYAHALRYFISYLQQADMESNGKKTGLNGETITYLTSPVIFGEEGCNGQHTYHQSLHQGQLIIPSDFILIGQQDVEQDIHQDVLMASALSQADALMRGKTYDEAYRELLNKHYPTHEAKELARHQVIPGNRPCNILFMSQLTPKNLGALIALYEHKIFVQGVIWGINSFDQFGVELGKQLLPNILQQIRNTSDDPHLSVTMGFIHHLKNIRNKR